MVIRHVHRTYIGIMAWKTEPTENVRSAFPDKYWFHNYDQRPHFMWDDIEVSEPEFRRYARADQISRADKAPRGA